MMMSKKQSFLERLTGSRDVGEEEGVHTISNEPIRLTHKKKREREVVNEVVEETDTVSGGTEDETEEEYESDESESEDEGEDDAQLAVDMFETGNEVIIQSMIAGVTPDNLHISITSENVTISGTRVAPEGIDDEQFHIKELYWGHFSREIELPYEVDTDGAEAVEKYGLLIIRLPRADKHKTAELKVRSI